MKKFILLTLLVAIISSSIINDAINAITKVMPIPNNKQIVKVGSELITKGIKPAAQMIKQTFQDVFNQWKKTTGANWKPAEQILRKTVFKKNFDFINSHNSDKSQTFQMGINMFSGLTQKQFKQMYLSGLKIIKQNKVVKPSKKRKRKKTKKAGPSIDWTKQKVVSRVQSQGDCSSCWSFVSIAAIQSFYMMKQNKKNIDFSQQQLIDCSSSFGNKGCLEGLPQAALKYVKKNGITTEKQYPMGKVQSKCKINSGQFKINSINSVKGCAQLQKIIYKSPAIVLVDSTPWAYYQSGILSQCTKKINHAVLLVGFNPSKGFWKIKNSWGPNWGQKGFMRLKAGNTCGICIYKSYWIK